VLSAIPNPDINHRFDGTCAFRVRAWAACLGNGLERNFNNVSFLVFPANHPLGEISLPGTHLSSGMISLASYPGKKTFHYVATR
jgi:hypothetical protein